MELCYLELRGPRWVRLFPVIYGLDTEESSDFVNYVEVVGLTSIRDRLMRF